MMNLFLIAAVAITAADAGSVVWRAAQDVPGLLHGRAFPRNATKAPYDRLPATAEKTCRPAIWSLSEQPAGMFLQFGTNSRTVQVKYNLTGKGLDMWHFPSTGVSGMDAYVWDAGNKTWRWTGTAHPAYPQTSFVAGQLRPCGGAAGEKPCPDTLYRVHLPTYNGVVGGSLLIGLSEGATLTPDASKFIGGQGAVVWYGTSILQGGVASRPGQIFTHEVSRNLGRLVYNFGFSGNGLMELSVAQYLAAIRPAPGLFILDCNPNMLGDLIGARAVPLIRYLRTHGWAETPIIMSEGTEYGIQWASPSTAAKQAAKNANLTAAFKTLVAGGDAHLFYSKGPPLFASPLSMAPVVAGDARLLVDPTVGGTHPTDLGMRKMAAYWTAEIAKVLAVDAKKKRPSEFAAPPAEQNALIYEAKDEEHNKGKGEGGDATAMALAGLAAAEMPAADPSPTTATTTAWKWTDGASLLGGRAPFSGPRNSSYDRLPLSAHGVVSDAVWRLSQDSTGLYLRFTTNASALSINHTLAFASPHLWHMPRSGTDGLDVYAWHAAAGAWRHVPSMLLAEYAPPPTPVTIAAAVPQLTPQPAFQTFIVYLPLRNAPSAVAIGIPDDDAGFVLCGGGDGAGSCAAMGVADPAPAFALPPVVWYGTSIQQGGVASRAGNEYDGVIARALHREVYNFGFAGHGLMELSVAKFITQLDASVIVIDCLPNMKAPLVASRTQPLVRYLRANGHATTPIVLAEGTPYPAEWLQGPPFADATKNAALRAAYEALVAAGDEHLHYVIGKDLFKSPLVNPTVGGVHSSDLGQYEIADFYVKYLPTVIGGAD